MSLRQLTILGVLTAASAIYLLLPTPPLGIPSEWLWNRHDLPTSVLDLVDRLWAPTFSGLALYVVAIYAGHNVERHGRLRIAISYLLLLTTSILWLSSVQQAAPSPHRELKPLWVLYDPSASGYFLQAAVDMPSIDEFLSDYEERMQEGDVLHVGTHPPGLFLGSHYCIALCEAWPPAAQLAQSLTSEATVSGFKELSRMARLSRPLKEHELAGLMLLRLVTQLAVPLALIPLAYLGWRLFGGDTAWKVCCLYGTLPCLAVFFPKSDVLFVLTSLSALALTTAAMTGKKARLLFAAAAGVVLWLGMMLSLAHLPTIAVLVFMTVARWYQSSFDRQQTRNDLIIGTTVLASLLVCSVSWSWVSNCNILRVWQSNLSNHAGFYEQYPRTYWKWLVANPVELAFAVGFPVAYCAIAGMPSVFWARSSDRNDSVSSDVVHQIQLPMLFGMCTVILMLWLSGKNQGEAARLWCFLTPWLLLLAGASLRHMCSGSWKVLMALQLAAGTITVMRVNGFSF